LGFKDQFGTEGLILAYQAFVCPVAIAEYGSLLMMEASAT